LNPEVKSRDQIIET